MAVSPDALICVRTKKSMDLPPKTPDTPLPRLWRSSAPAQNAKSAWPPAIHHRQPTWLVAISGAAHPPSASALRSLFVPRACRCSLSQSKRDAAATTACLLPRAISPPMLTALFFCLASADRICLLRHCITFADFTTNILTDSPMSCSTFLSGTIAVLYCTVMCTVHSFGRRRSHRIAVPLAQHCDG